MPVQPSFNSARLLLRPLTKQDATGIQQLANDQRIASVTASIPYPYPQGLASQWIAQTQQGWLEQSEVSFGIVLQSCNRLIGTFSLLNIQADEAEIAYWLGVDYWGNGYASEACQTMVDYAFEGLNFRRIKARVLVRNSASSKLLTRLGFRVAGEGRSVCGYKQLCEPIVIYEQLNTKPRPAK